MTSEERQALEELPPVQRAIFKRLTAYHRGPGNGVSATDLGAHFNLSARVTRDYIHGLRLFIAKNECPIKEVILGNPEQGYFLADRDREADETIGKLHEHTMSCHVTLKALQAARLKKFGPPPPPKLFEEAL